MSERFKGVDKIANKGLWIGGAVALLGVAAFPVLTLPGVVVAGTSASWKIGRGLSKSKK